MPLSSGTYIIHHATSTDPERVFDYWVDRRIFICCGLVHRGKNQQWHVQAVPGGVGYTIQSVETRSHLKVDDDQVRNSCPHDATIWHFEHDFGDNYVRSMMDSKSRLWYPGIQANPQQVVYVSQKDRPDGYLWRLEKISDDFGNIPPYTVRISTPPPSRSPSSSGPKANLAQNSFHPQVNDAHFFTDVMFNSPRAPFTQVQRAAALDWARRLGATNVPTMESFSECERILGAKQNENNNAGDH